MTVSSLQSLNRELLKFFEFTSSSHLLSSAGRATVYLYQSAEVLKTTLDTVAEYFMALSTVTQSITETEGWVAILDDLAHFKLLRATQLRKVFQLNGSEILSLFTENDTAAEMLVHECITSDRDIQEVMRLALTDASAPAHLRSKLSL
jgi:hypothetical protein